MYGDSQDTPYAEQQPDSERFGKQPCSLTLPDVIRGSPISGNLPVPAAARHGYRAVPYTTLPPTMVMTTAVLPIVSGGAAKISCYSTARSASLPASSVPTLLSEKAAYAEPAV